MHRKITRQSRWNLRRASDKAIPNQVPGMVGEGVETGWRASLVDEGTVRLSPKGESDRITQRSAVQIRPPTMNATAKMQWRSPVFTSFPLRRFWTVSRVMTIEDPQGYHPSQLSESTVNAW